MLIKHLTVNSVQQKEAFRVLVPFLSLFIRHQQVFAIVLEKRTKNKQKPKTQKRRVPQRKKSMCRTRMDPDSGRMYKSISNQSLSSGENMQNNPELFWTIIEVWTGQHRRELNSFEEGQSQRSKKVGVVLMLCLALKDLLNRTCYTEPKQDKWLPIISTCNNLLITYPIKTLIYI